MVRFPLDRGFRHAVLHKLPVRSLFVFGPRHRSLQRHRSVCACQRLTYFLKHHPTFSPFRLRRCCAVPFRTRRSSMPKTPQLTARLRRSVRFSVDQLRQCMAPPSFGVVPASGYIPLCSEKATLSRSLCSRTSLHMPTVVNPCLTFSMLLPRSCACGRPPKQR